MHIVNTSKEYLNSLVNIQMSKLKITSTREVEIMRDISQWAGEINTPLGLLLRNKTYECFNEIIYKIGIDLSKVIRGKGSEKGKIEEIKKILISYNIHTESPRK